MSRDRQHVEHRLVGQRKRPLGAAQHAVEVEAAVLLAQMGEVVAGQAAVERREDRLDALALLLDDLAGGAIGAAPGRVLGAQGLEFVLVDRGADQAFAADQHAVEFEHVVAGLAVFAATLAAGVGGDHAADGRPVGGGQFRCEEQPMGPQGGVELVLDHPGLDPHPAVFDVDLEDLVHVPGDVHHQAVAQRLAVGSGAATTWRQGHLAKGFKPGEPAEQLEVSGMTRKHRRLGQALVERVVGGKYRAAGVVRGDLAFEAFCLEGLEKAGVKGGQAGRHL